jgi:hypothetical protein
MFVVVSGTECPHHNSNTFIFQLVKNLKIFHSSFLVRFDSSQAKIGVF